MSITKDRTAPHRLRPVLPGGTTTTADYCVETRDALAAELGMDNTLIDHNLDVLPDPITGRLEAVIWHELLAPRGQMLVTAFRWDSTGWFYTDGLFDALHQHLTRWTRLPVPAEASAQEFARVAAGACRGAPSCFWCRQRIQLFGGVWFERGRRGGQSCPVSPGTEHTPASSLPGL